MIIDTYDYCMELTSFYKGLYGTEAPVMHARADGRSAGRAGACRPGPRARAHGPMGPYYIVGLYYYIIVLHYIILYNILLLHYIILSKSAARSTATVP